MRWWQGRARPPRRGVLGRWRSVGLGSGGGRALRPAALAGSFRNERGRHSGSAWQRPGFQGTVAFWGTCSHHEAVCDVLGGSSVHTAESGPRRDVPGALGGTPEAWGSAAAGDTEAARGSPCGGPRRHGGVSTRRRPVGPRAPAEAARAPRVQPRHLHPNPPSQHADADATPTPDAEPRCQTASAPRSPVVRVSGKALRLL